MLGILDDIEKNLENIKRKIYEFRKTNEGILPFEISENLGRFFENFSEKLYYGKVLIVIAESMVNNPETAKKYREHFEEEK